MEWIGTKQGEGCIEGEGGGGIVTKGEFGGEGREEGGHNSMAQRDLDSQAIKRILRAAAATYMRK